MTAAAKMKVLTHVGLNFLSLSADLLIYLDSGAGIATRRLLEGYMTESVVFKEKAPDKYDKKEGSVELHHYYEDGKRHELTFKDGIKEGPSRIYYENGMLETEVTFKNGELDGPAKYYYENGQLLAEGTLKDGKLNGIVKKYDEDGRFEKEVTFKDGDRE